MIFYFSGTGNSRWVAQQMASLTGDQAKDLVKLDKAPSWDGEKQIGLVFPIYAWGVPEPVLNFVKGLPPTKAFTFAICTCGEEAGLALKKLAKLYPLRSCYSLVMPNNYIFGADVDDEATIRRKIRQAKESLDTIAQEVLAHKEVYRVEEGSHPGLKSGMVNWGFNRFARNTKPFFATDACVSCGICAKNCPASTITLVNGKPSWGKTCYQCLRCIHSCPQHAIQYGKNTESKGRYTIDPYVKGESSGQK